MKRKIVIGLAIMTLCFMVGCGNSNETDSTQEGEMSFNRQVEKDQDAEEDMQIDRSDNLQLEDDLKDTQSE